MANTKQDFYNWVIEAYPGWWPEDLDKVDWTLPPQAKKLEAWKAAGYPAGTPAGPSGTVEGAGQGLLQPMVTEEEEGAFPDDLVEFVPGRIFYSPSTKKYYAADNVGDPTTIIVTQEDALNERNRWAKTITEGGDAGRTPQWKPGELEFQKEQFDWQKKQTLREEQQAQGELARTYEEYRRRLLSELTDPSDWITRWMVGQTPEKLPAPAGEQEPQRGRMLYDFEIIEGETLGPGDVVITDSAQTAAKLGATLWIPRKKIDDEMIATSIRQQFQWRDEGAFAKPKSNQEIFQEARWTAAMNQIGPGRGAGTGVWDITQAVNPDWVPQRQMGESPSWGQVLAAVKGTPPSPGWLPQFAPGQTTGRPITKERLAPPSGQSWLATPWSQREGLGGFAEWSGQSFTDVLNQMAMMQTTTPRGAGQARWAPRTQRTAV